MCIFSVLRACLQSHHGFSLRSLLLSRYWDFFCERLYNADPASVSFLRASNVCNKICGVFNESAFKSINNRSGKVSTLLMLNKTVYFEFSESFCKLMSLFFYIKLVFNASLLHVRSCI